MITSGLVSNSLLPSGLCSSCQFLQWGYWTGTLNTPDMAGTTVIRQDAAHINPWIAGVISSSLPATGVGTFTGNAFGSVFNNGASYLVAGQFSNAYNFGRRTGTLAINNFDGRSFSGTVAAVNRGDLFGGAGRVRPDGLGKRSVLRPSRCGDRRQFRGPFNNRPGIPRIGVLGRQALPAPPGPREKKKPRRRGPAERGW